MTVIYAFLAIGIIIFLHELGHFMAAKFVGVPVERFALGFDPYKLRLFSFKPGEYIELLGRFRISLGASNAAGDDSQDPGQSANGTTSPAASSPEENVQTEYLIGLVPFGGYVKMTGENPEEEEGASPDGLQNKSAGARALVFVAGVVMNIISGFFFFILAFSAGVEFPAATVGGTIQGMPAWEAGLRTGDQIVEVDGKPVKEYTEVLLGIALGERGTKVDIKVERPASKPGDSPVTLDFSVPRAWNAARGMSSIGLQQVSAAATLAGEPPNDSAAHKAGLKKGDRIVGATLGGVELPPLPSQQLMRVLLHHIQLFPAEAVDLAVARDGHPSPLKIRLEAPQDPKAPVVPRIGVAAGGGSFVKNIAGGSDAESIFKPGDRLLSIDGEPVHSMQWEQLSKHYAKDSLALKLLRAGKENEAVLSGKKLLRLLLTDEVQWTGRDLEVGALPEGNAAYKAGLRKSDRVLRIGDREVYSIDDLSAYLAENTQENHELVVSRKSEEKKLTLSAGALEEDAGITWRTFPTISMVTPNGPAAMAGITAGSKIHEINGKEIFSFADLSAGITAYAAENKDSEAAGKLKIGWIDAKGDKQEGSLAAASPAPANWGFVLKSATVVVNAGIGGSFKLGIERSIITVDQVFLTLRSLIRRDVEAKNLAGPVGIIHIFSRVAAGSLVQLLFWMGMVSMNLAVLNLLPIPILDGGHLFFLLIEKLKGSPVSTRIQFASMQVAMILFLSMALYVTWNDITRLFSGF
ncbi:MAG: RIP metalloprotease RseP [Planctomycetota bacterium]|nr:RIP metalloprotease RseP [Planctomycetota bacterium]